MANYNNNNGFVPITTNTSSISYFSDEDVMLKQSFYTEGNNGGGISLSFCMAEQDPTTGKNKYPKDKRQSLILNVERAAAFENMINTCFIPKYTKGEPCSFGIFLNNRNDAMLEICLSENKTVSLRYTTNINENKIPGNIYYFPFKKTMMIKDYNTNNGNCDVSEIDGLFFAFCRGLRAFNDSNSLAYAHNEKHSNKYTQDQIIKQVGEIAIKLGLTPTVPGFNGGTYQAPNISQTNNSTPSMENVENLEDLLNSDLPF